VYSGAKWETILSIQNIEFLPGDSRYVWSAPSSITFSINNTGTALMFYMSTHHETHPEYFNMYHTNYSDKFTSIWNDKKWHYIVVDVKFGTYHNDTLVFYVDGNRVGDLQNIVWKDVGTTHWDLRLTDDVVIVGPRQYDSAQYLHVGCEYDTMVPRTTPGGGSPWMPAYKNYFQGQLSAYGIHTRTRNQSFYANWYAAMAESLKYVPSSAVSYAPKISEMALIANPNPFSRQTHIQWSTKQQERVGIFVYDINGREVDCLYNGFSNGFKAVSWKPVGLASGTYFIRMNKVTSGSTVRINLQ
jgi:hypothetical protein